MDSRAKQRLTGAIILVALFVLLVPELLTGPRETASDAPNEEGMRRYTIDLDAPTSGTPAAPPAPEVALPPVAQAQPAASDIRAVPGEAAQPDTAGTDSAGTAAPAPSVVTPMAPAPQPVAATPTASKPPASSTPAVIAAPAPAVPAVVATPAPVRRNDTPTPAAAPGTRGAFAVQLGSFVNKDNAQKLVREMNAKGFSAFLAPPITTGGRELWRVRVGPTRDRASAEALATQLRRIGQIGSIVSIS